MPIFELEAGGKSFEVDAPSMDAALAALRPAAPQAQPQLTHDTADQFYNAVGMPQRSMGEQASDAAQSLGTGLVHSAGFLGDTASALNRGVDQLLNKVGVPQNGPQPNYTLGTNAQLERMTGPLHQPQTTIGDYAQTIGENALGAALPGGPLARAANVVLPAVFSETAGQATKGTAAEVPARILGGLAGGLVPGLAGRAVTPFPATAERTALANTLDQAGVPLSAGQRTGLRPLQWMEQAAADTPLASGRAAAMNEAQQRGFTGAALRRMGMSGDEIATPQAIDAGVRDLGQRFDALSARNTLQPDAQFGRDIIGSAQRYVDTVIPSQRVAGRQNVETIIQDVVDQMRQQGGVMPGQLYQATRSRLGGMADGVRQSDPQLSTAIRGIRNALDGAMDRSISPADQQAWQQARTQWRNWKAIEKAASGAGAGVAEGYISPSQLRSAVAGQNRGQYARGQGDMADLTRAGEALLRPLPQSGTAPRQAAGNLFASLAGGGAGAAVGGPFGAIAGAAVPALVGRAVLSRPVQAYLGNQLMAGAGGNPIAQAVMAAANNSNQSRRGDARSRMAAALLQRVRH